MTLARALFGLSALNHVAEQQQAEGAEGKRGQQAELLLVASIILIYEYHEFLGVTAGWYSKL